LQAIRQKFGSTYSLSTAIGAGQWRSGLSYDIPQIFQACDFVNVMTYELHGGWESYTGIHGALFRSSLDNTALNVHESVQYISNCGVQKEKVIMGIPAYGKRFRLNNANYNGVGAPACGDGELKFSQICPRTNSGNLYNRWDNDQKTPYCYSGTEWIGYDDVRSVTEKCNYIKNNGYGGAMLWNLDSDDCNGNCGYGNYPLTSTAYNSFYGSYGSETVSSIKIP
jgi:chitinase